MTLRQEQRQLARQRIIDAAQRMFLKKGYTGATVDEIAVDAGLSRATFYLYFKSKKEVIAALVEENIGPFRDLFAVLPLDPDSSEREIQRWIDGLFAYYDRMQERVSVYREAAILDTEIREMSEGNFRLVIAENWSRIAPGVSQNSARGRKTVGRFLLFMSLLDTAAYLATTRAQIDRKIVKAELTALWRQFFGPGRADR